MSVSPDAMIATPSAISRVYGFGSVFGKALRDSRWALLLGGVLVGSLALMVAATLAMQFPEASDRQGLVGQMAAMPAMFRGLLGEPINIDTLAGFISWRSLNFMPIMIGIWSVITLSGAVAGEVSRGSMELLAASSVSRPSIALQKAAAHVTALLVAMAIAAVLTWLSTVVFAAFPGDEATLGAALSEFLWIAVGSLFGGAVAFALGPLLGRAAAAGIGVMTVIGMYVVNGFAEAVTFFDQIRSVSIFHWTSGHRPLAGIEDWGPVIAVAIIDGALILVGVVLFARRDIGGVWSTGISPFAADWSVRGPTVRSLAERLPAALAFGLGIGAFGFYIAVSAESFAEVLGDIPQMRELLEAFFPGVDVLSASGILGLMFVQFAVLLLGLAAAVLAHGWASDERDGRLEMVLGSPIQRLRWVIGSGAGALLSVSVMVVVVAVLIALGTLTIDDDIVVPLIGMLVMGVYTAALVGVGVAVGGWFSPAVAGAVVGAYVIGTYILEFIGTALDLPGWLLDLSLARHLGDPFLGDTNIVGVAVCALLAVGGVAVGAFGLARRDLKA